MQGTINGPFGPKAQTYVDFAASGRPLPQVEQFMQQNVQPYYANTHTETADCGRYMSSLYEQARHTIARELQADLSQYAVIFTGSGCTGALDKLARALLGSADSEHGRWLPWRQSALLPVVFIGPHEHHSNEVLWRERRCVVVTIPETPDGHICQAALTRQLQAYAHHPLRLGSFSAGSNVTGITQDVDALASLLHSHGALACFDYAGAGPYVPCSLAAPAGQPLAYKDAVTLSPHKLLGGPGACGLLVARRELFGAVPTVPGGGTVLFVAPSRHEYVHSVEEREEAGTPNILGALRCGLAFSLRSALGAATIQRLSSSAIHALIAALHTSPNIVLLGSSAAAYHSSSRLPIISMLFKGPSQASSTPSSSAAAGAASSSKLKQGMLLHHSFVCKLLNDVYGIQARSGCSCAGPYGHLLLDVCEQVSRQQQELARAGEACIKAGWVRVSLSFTAEPVDVQYVAAALHQVAEHGWRLLPQYVMDVGSGAWQHASMAGQPLQQAYPSCTLTLPKGSPTSATSLTSTPPAASPPPPAAAGSEPEGAEPLDSWAAGDAAAIKAMARFATAQAECYSLLQEHVWQPAEAALGQPAKLPAGQRGAVYRRQLQQAAQLYERAGEWVQQQRGGAHGSSSSSSSSSNSMSAALQRHRWWLMPEEATSLLQSNAVQSATSRQKPQHETAPAAPAATAAEGGDLKLPSGLAKAAALASSKALVVAEAVACDSPSGPTTPARVSADDVAKHFRSSCSSSTLLITRLAGSSTSNLAVSNGRKRSSTDGGEDGCDATIAQQSGASTASTATAAAVLSASALMGLQAGQSLVLRCWAGAVRLEGSGAEGLRLQLLQGQ